MSATPALARLGSFGNVSARDRTSQFGHNPALASGSFKKRDALFDAPLSRRSKVDRTEPHRLLQDIGFAEDTPGNRTNSSESKSGNLMRPACQSALSAKRRAHDLIAVGQIVPSPTSRVPASMRRT